MAPFGCKSRFCRFAFVLREHAPALYIACSALLLAFRGLCGSVGPGDQVRLEVEILREMRGVVKFGGKASVEGQTAAEADLLCTYRKISGGATA